MPETLPAGADLVPVSVVVVNYNAGAVLAECLRSVLSQARQVVLVDNASDQDSFQRVVARFAGHPRLVVETLPDNVGFAAGCNRGLALCDQPVILVLNPDCVATAGSLRTMLEVLQGDPAVGMVGGFVCFPDGREQGGGRRAVPTPWRSFVRGFGLARFADRWPRLFDDFHLHLQPLPPGPISVEAISGACTMVKREAVEHVGFMDEGYFLHCEDLDLCMRFRQRGWDIRFVPHAPVLHHKGVCGRKRPLFVEWHKHKGMVRFYRKHFRHQYPWGLMGLVTLGVWTRFGAVASRHVAGRFRTGLAGLPAAMAGRIAARSIKHRKSLGRRPAVATEPLAS